MGARPTSIASYIALLPKLPARMADVLYVMYATGVPMHARDLYKVHASFHGKSVGGTVNDVNSLLSRMLKMGLVKEVGVAINTDSGKLMRTVEPTWNTSIAPASQPNTSTTLLRYYAVHTDNSGGVHFTAPMKKADACAQARIHQSAGFNAWVVKRNSGNALIVE